jgi:hypothetical protein
LNLSVRYACVPSRADRKVASPRSESVNVIRLRSSSWVRRITKSRTTRPSTSVDMDGKVSPMCSAASESEAPLWLLMKSRVRNCGTDSTWPPCFLSCVRIPRMTNGTTSKTSRAHCSCGDSKCCILIRSSNGSIFELFYGFPGKSHLVTKCQANLDSCMMLFEPRGLWLEHWFRIRDPIV